MTDKEQSKQREQQVDGVGKFFVEGPIGSDNPFAKIGPTPGFTVTVTKRPSLLEKIARSFLLMKRR